jgi:type II secretory pathway pseudopilin PulG
VELVVSLGIMSVLAVGVSSAVVVSMRAVETANSQSTRIRQATDVSNQMASELSGALAVTEKGTTALTMFVPDRDNNGASEEIRYSWSGVAGDPLLRRYNGNTPTAILNNVWAFGLAYDLVSVPTAPLGADRLLAGHHSGNDLGTFRIKTYDWLSQSFKVSLPSGGSYWKVTRAVIYCKQVGDPGGRLTARLCTGTNDGRPSGSAFCQATVWESDLQISHSWYSIDLHYSNYLSAYATYCLVLSGNVSDVCEVKFHSNNVSQASYALYVSSNGGSTWTNRSGQALLFELYGVPASGNGSEQAETRLGIVRWELQAGNDTGARLHAGAQTVNLPE